MYHRCNILLTVQDCSVSSGGSNSVGGSFHWAPVWDQDVVVLLCTAAVNGSIRQAPLAVSLLGSDKAPPTAAPHSIHFTSPATLQSTDGPADRRRWCRRRRPLAGCLWSRPPRRGKVWRRAARCHQPLQQCGRQLSCGPSMCSLSVHNGCVFTVKLSNAW